MLARIRRGRATTRRIGPTPPPGDFVLRGKDNAASYHLAVVVDDALQGVSDVVRGRDLLAATSAHRLLQALLGLAVPRYRHHRLVLTPRAPDVEERLVAAAARVARGGIFGLGGARAALGFAAPNELRLTVSFS